MSVEPAASSMGSSSTTAADASRPTSAGTPGTSAGTPGTSAGTPGTSGTSSTTTLRLTRGEIPRTWATPAEVASSTVPVLEPRRSPVLVMAAAGGLAVVVALGVWMARASSSTTTPDAPARPAPAVAKTEPVEPPPVESIPRPPPTSSTAPSGVAPEDQGGMDDPPPPPVAKAATTTAPAPTPTPPATAVGMPPAPAGADIVTELPVRKKAKALTTRAIASLREGDFAAAEPVLVRAVLIDPTYADGWRHLGIARAQLGDRDGARRAYKKYLALAPDAPDAAQVKAILAP